MKEKKIRTMLQHQNKTTTTSKSFIRNMKSVVFTKSVGKEEGSPMATPVSTLTYETNHYNMQRQTLKHHELYRKEQAKSELRGAKLQIQRSCRTIRRTTLTTCYLTSPRPILIRP
jgi:hypothetical protein